MKFGLIGPGTIARKFADAISRMEEMEIVAVASSKMERAEEFAKDFQIKKAYDSYEDMVNDPEVEAVYISIVNTLHYKMAKLCIDAGKPVLCEKPLGSNVTEAEDLIAYAKEKKVLLMEGMWTLHLPGVQAVKRWIDEGRIGKVKYMESIFSFFMPVMRDHRLFAPELGGGAVLDVGVYCLAFSLFMSNTPLVSCVNSVYSGETGVDEMGAALLQFEDGLVANCRFGMQGNTANDAFIFGDQGKIELPEFWDNKKVILKNAAGEIVEELQDESENGFVYEIRAFADAAAKGALEVCPTDHSLSIQCAKLMEKIRKNELAV